MKNLLSAHPTLKGAVLCLLGYFLFSASDAIGKQLVVQYDVWTILFWSGIISLLLMIPFSGFLGGVGTTLRTKRMKLHLLRGVVTFASSSLAVYAFGHLPMVDAYTLIFMSPFVVVLIAAAMFGEKPNAAQILCIVSGFVGIVIAMRPGFEEVTLGSWAALGVSFLYSVSMLLAKPLGLTETRLSLAFYPTIGSIIGGLIMLHGVVVMPDMADLPFFVARGAILFGGTLAMSLAFSMISGGLLAPLHYSQLIWGLLIGLVFFGDFPDLLTMFGATIIVVSGLVLLRSEQRKRAMKVTDYV